MKPIQNMWIRNSPRGECWGLAFICVVWAKPSHKTHWSHCPYLALSCSLCQTTSGVHLMHTAPTQTSDSLVQAPKETRGGCDLLFQPENPPRHRVTWWGLAHVGLETGMLILQLEDDTTLVTFNHYYIHRILSALTFTYYFSKNNSGGVFGGDLSFKWPACRQDANT